MARRFRRRKPGVLWLPVVGNDLSQEPEVTYPVVGLAGSLEVSGSGSVANSFNHITFDQPLSAARAQDNSSLFENPPYTLHDIAQGNAYRLRRIVGKCFLTHAAFDGFSPPAIDVAAGFIVCRVDDDGIPIGFTGNVLAQDAAEDPWIWRRRWLLGLNPQSGAWAGLSNQAYTAYPVTTAGYGSVADGPHIDQKTARVISNDQRLFFMLAARATGPALPYASDSTLFFDVDFRILASLRSQVGNRRNASR